MGITSQFSGMTLSLDCFNIALFLLPNLVTGPSFMSISSLVLELLAFLIYWRGTNQVRIIPPPPAPSPLPHIKSNARIRINSINFKSGSYPKYSVDFKVKDATFKADDRVRISKYIQSRRTIFLKDMLLIGHKKSVS